MCLSSSPHTHWGISHPSSGASRHGQANSGLTPWLSHAGEFTSASLSSTACMRQLAKPNQAGSRAAAAVFDRQIHAHLRFCILETSVMVLRQKHVRL